MRTTVIQNLTCSRCGGGRPGGRVFHLHQPQTFVSGSGLICQGPLTGSRGTSALIVEPRSTFPQEHRPDFKLFQRGDPAERVAADRTVTIIRNSPAGQEVLQQCL